jgi:hypothetical protein
MGRAVAITCLSETCVSDAGRSAMETFADKADSCASGTTTLLVSSEPIMRAAYLSLGRLAAAD